MRIAVGSRNPAKLEAVRESLQGYPALRDAEVVGVVVGSDVSEQPMSLDETMRGAMNRAEKAFALGPCALAVGIESGLVHIPNTKSGYMNVGVVSFFDGKRHHLGLGPGFEYPPDVIRLVLKDGIDINQAYFRLGLSGKEKVGSEEGAIGLLTKGRLPRKEYVKIAVMMALIHIENSGLYCPAKTNI
ncbi:inosine/xanthosine triphosphatase [Candidatus Woesearchaeota archaeon]|nr:inosine/xanthosine triphosphatase [Candidatus Woesearchaeota archaeon]